jgi:hypothetical protein
MQLDALDSTFLEPPSPAGGSGAPDLEYYPFDDATPPKSPANIKLETRGLKPQNQQTELYDKQLTLKHSIAAKLREAGMEELALSLEDCGTHKTYCKCNSCGKTQVFLNRCDNTICPCCQPKIARDRRRDIEWWSTQVHQPKHVVLTLRNVPTLEKAHIIEAKKWLTALRRSKFAENWRGGCWSLEVTNEGRGWHIHFHLLVDANWVDAKKLAIQWNKTTNGHGYIVKVMDARKEDYLRELTKYCVKGTDLAKWSPEDLKSFVLAIQDTRCFSVFGSLFGQREEFRKFKEEAESTHHLCPCGSDNCRLYNEWEWLQHQLEPQLTPPRSDLNARPEGYTDLFNDDAYRRNYAAVRG